MRDNAHIPPQSQLLFPEIAISTRSAASLLTKRWPMTYYLIVPLNVQVKRIRCAILGKEARVLAKEAIAQILQQEGVRVLAAFPDNAVIDAAAALDIRPIITRTERVAVNIADAYSRVSDGRQIGVCALQYAAGVENAFAGVAQAYGDSSPILILPSGYERCEQGIAPNFQATLGLREVTRWAVTATSADRVPQLLQSAFTRLRNGKPGPVLIETPTDVMDEALSRADFHYLKTKALRSAADPQDVRELAGALLRARTPVIVAGQGVFYARACAELRELAELLGVPVLTTLNGKSAFPEQHPLALGTGGRSRPRTVDHFLDQADLVLGIGTSFTRSTYTVAMPPGVTLAQITNASDDVNKEYPVSYGAIGDAKLVLRQLIEHLTALGVADVAWDRAAVVREIRTVREQFLREWWPRLSADTHPISPYRVIWELMQTLDRRRAIVTHDSGNPRDQMVPFFEATTPHGYIGWGKTTQLGSGLGLAMGAKLAAPERFAVNLMGDAAFGMVGLDFETAVRCRIPILTVVMNNGLMGGYQKFLPISSEKYGARFLGGDFAKVAEALGGYTERVERADDLVPALHRAIAEVDAGRATLLEVITREEPVLALGASSRYQ
jgi:acetolactate synthase-1/2/3 large subunit